MANIGCVRRRRDKRTGKWRYYLDFRDGANQHPDWSALANPPHRFLYSNAGVGWRTRGAAENTLEVIRDKIAQGIHPVVAIGEHRTRSARGLLVTAKAREWLERVEVQCANGEIDPYTARGYRHLTQKHVPWWGTRFMRQVGPATLEQWRDHLEHAGYKPKTIHNIFLAFHVFLGWYRTRVDPSFVIPPMPKVRVEQTLPRTLTIEQQSRVLAAIPELHRGIFLAMARFALRPGEARALVGADYDPRAGKIHVWRAMKGQGRSARRGPTKTRRSMRYNVGPDLRAWLDARPTPIGEAPLFPDETGRPYIQDDLNALWNAAVERARVPAINLYNGVRHSTATAMLAAVAEGRLSLYRVQEFLRHGSIQTTERWYLAYQTPDGVAQASLELESLLGLSGEKGKANESGD